MITSGLTEYIKAELNENVSKDLIISSLLEAGWIKEDIDEGFSDIENNKLNPKIEKVDQYRELPDEGDPMELKVKLETESEKEAEGRYKLIADNQLKTAPVVVVKPLRSSNVYNNNVSHIASSETPIEYNPREEVSEIDKIILDTEKNIPIMEIPEAVIPITEVPIASIPTDKKPEIIAPTIEVPVAIKTETVATIPVFSAPINIENIKTEIKPKENIEISKEVLPSKIWIPTTIKPIESNIILNEEKKIKEGNELGIQNIEISNSKEETILPKINLIKIESKENQGKGASHIEPLLMNEQIIKSEINPIAKIETPFIPKEPTKVASISNSFDILPPKKKEVIKEFVPISNIAPSIQNLGLTKITEAPMRSAMISSYRQDMISSVVQEDNNIIKTKKKNLPLKLGILIVVLILIGGMLFAFVEGYIKIPGSKFSFFVVQKDPKVVLLNAPSTISKLKSYKTETNINISSPSLSNISIGLSSGDVVNSKDKETMSIDVKGATTNTDQNEITDNIYNIKSTLLKNDIKTNIKKHGSSIYITIPDLSQILVENTPEPTTLSLNRDQVGLVINELLPDMQALIKKLDVYNIVSSETPPYVTNELSFIFKDFINTFEFVNKGEESIHGVDTYHYEVTITRANTKKLLSSLSSLFMTQLNDEEKKVLEEAIGASSIDSFEVWIGKSDDNLYQIKFSASAPLSKILRLNDSGIAGNEVKLGWTTTYYDLDIENKINSPTAEVNAENFIKNIQNIKIKNIISSLKPQSTLFKNAVGSYGKKINTGGSCTTPVSGSMFSPLGQTKGADTAIGSISTIMKSVLSITKGEGYCYSTPNAWALIVPLSTTPISYYCADSEGNKTTILSPVTETSCIPK